MFLWLLDNVCLRVKREPQDLDQQALLNLLDEAPDQADLTACLTWRTSPSAEIDRVGFVAGHGSPWVIPLSELLAAETPNIVVTMPRRTPVVASRLSPEQATDVEGAASATNDN